MPEKKRISVEQFNILLQRIRNFDLEPFCRYYSFFGDLTEMAIEHCWHRKYFFTKYLSPELKKDIAQKVYLKFFASLPDFYLRNPVAWYFTLAVNVATTEINREFFAIKRLPPEPARQIDIEDMLIQKDELQACLKMLTPKEKRIVLMHAVESFTFREIAQICRMPQSTVRSKYQRACEKIRRKYSETDL